MKRLDARMWIVYFGLFLALVVGLVMGARGGVLKAEAGWSDPQDSVWIIKSEDGVVVDSVKYTSVTFVDTSLTVPDGITTNVTFKHWYPGEANYLTAQFTWQGVPANLAGIGSGSNNWKIWVKDTANGVFLAKAKVTTRFLTGTPDVIAETGTSGFIDGTVDLDTFTVDIYKPGYFHTQDTIVVASDGQIDTVKCYRDAIPASGGPALATVFVDVYFGGYPLKGARLLIENLNQATDTTQGTLIGMFSADTLTDSTGRASIVVPKSYIYHDSTKAGYHITLKKRRRLLGEWTSYWVPDQDSVRLLITD